MQLANLLQKLRVGTGLTQLNTDRPRHPVEQPYDRAASHHRRHPKTQDVCNSRCSSCRCCWHAIKFHFSPLHNCRVWQCLKLIMWSLLLHLLFVRCAFGKLPWQAADFTSETLTICLINHAQAEAAKVSRDLSKRRPLRGPRVDKRAITNENIGENVNCN